MICVKTELINPLGGPIYHIAETASTMEEARLLCASGERDGTTVYADFQSAGRGRVDGRYWHSPKRENLLCTTFLRRAPVPGFTLRVGLAIALTIDSFLPENTPTEIKWPNDILFNGKKLAGILCENDGSVLYVGTGINVYQKDFPGELAAKATSLAIIPGSRLPPIEQVLQCYLGNLKKALSLEDWHGTVSAKMHRIGQRISFLSGDPGKKEIIEGYLEGIGPSGEILLRPVRRTENGTCGEDGILRLFSGEIPYA
jgi:BirA family biotin operon repressor/biotin-[acetyl-CoA-carboxylase] ligase